MLDYSAREFSRGHDRHLDPPENDLPDADDFDLDDAADAMEDDVNTARNEFAGEWWATEDLEALDDASLMERAKRFRSQWRDKRAEVVTKAIEDGIQGTGPLAGWVESQM